LRDLSAPGGFLHSSSFDVTPGDAFGFIGAADPGILLGTTANIRHRRGAARRNWIIGLSRPRMSFHFVGAQQENSSNNTLESTVPKLDV